MPQVGARKQAAETDVTLRQLGTASQIFAVARRNMGIQVKMIGENGRVGSFL